MSLKQLIKTAVATDIKKTADQGRLPINPLAQAAADCSRVIAAATKPHKAKS